MPVIKQAKKRMRQDRTRAARNQHYASRMKSMIKLVMTYVEKGELDKAKQILPKVVSSIDTAAKKNLIHSHNAAHKKSRIEKALTAAGKHAPGKDAEAPAKTEKAETPATSDKKVEEKAEKKAPAKKKDDK